MFETKSVNLVMGIRNFLFTKDGTVDDYNNMQINKIWFWRKKIFIFNSDAYVDISECSSI